MEVRGFVAAGHPRVSRAPLASFAPLDGLLARYWPKKGDVMATNSGQMVDGAEMTQPAPGSGTPVLARDGQAYWRCRALSAEARLRALYAEYGALLTSRPPPAGTST
jgi:hypothetical protein